MFWKTIQLLNQVYSLHILTLQDIDGAKLIDSSLDKAITLIFNHRQPPLLDPPSNLLPLNECPTELLCTEKLVFELLSNLDVTKSTSSDGISSKMHL